MKRKIINGVMLLVGLFFLQGAVVPWVISNHMLPLSVDLVLLGLILVVYF